MNRRTGWNYVYIEVGNAIYLAILRCASKHSYYVCYEELVKVLY